jgi:hypothetical protein
MRILGYLLIAAMVLAAVTAVATEKEKPYVAPSETTKQNLICTGAIAVDCSGAFVHDGDNTGAPNNVAAYSCVGWPEGGGEVVYELVIPEGQCRIISADLTNMTADLDVFFLGSCDEDDCLDYGNTGFDTECLGAGTYYIVVDGYGGAACAYTLTVECVYCDCPVEPCCVIVEPRRSATRCDSGWTSAPTRRQPDRHGS